MLIDRAQDEAQATEIGEESYVDVGDDRVLFHTEVSTEYSGQGLASTLVRSVFDDVIATGRSIVPVCAYVAGWLPKHPEYQSHVIERRPEHVSAVKARES